MQFVFKPEGAKPKSWTFVPGKLMNVESEKIEELTGWTYAEFGQQLMTGSTRAYHALLYIFLKREIPTIKYDEVVFAYDDIDLDLDANERRDIIARMREAGDDLDPEQRAFLETLILEANYADGVDEEDDASGESFAQPSDVNGSGSSPTSST